MIANALLIAGAVFFGLVAIAYGGRIITASLFLKISSHSINFRYSAIAALAVGAALILLGLVS